MANVMVKFNRQHYHLACQNGEEQRLLKLVGFVEDKAADIARSMGAVSDFRLLLMTAISLADQLDETRDTADGKDPRDRAAHMERTLVNTLKHIEDITREAESGSQTDF